MSLFELLLIVILFQNLISVRSYEYCKREAKLCNGQTKKHIQPQSKYKKHYPMTSVFRNWIVYWHNFYRNEVACGKVQGSEEKLPAASRMRELAWDYELEYLASVHAGRCKMQHDLCRNTERIPISGQNLAYKKTNGPIDRALTRAHDSVLGWFSEHDNVTVPIIKKYQTEEGVKIAHFTVLANDMVGRVGCGMTVCTGFSSKNESDMVYTYFTCNYDYTNVLTYPVYRIGKSASYCKYFDVGKSSNFSCLCAKSF